MMNGFKIITLYFIVAIFQGTAASAKCSSAALNKISRSALSSKVSKKARGSKSNGNSFENKVLIRSDQIFGKMSKLIPQAKKNVYIQTWRFEPKSKPAKYLARGIKKLNSNLKKKRLKPVHVWLLVNVIDVQSKKRELRKINQYIKVNKLHSKHVKMHVGIFDAKILAVNHAKSIVIDNKVAIISGANFSKNNNGLGFYDLGFVAHGKIVHTLAKDIISVWPSHLKDKPPLPQATKQGCTPTLFTKSFPYPKFSTKIQKSSVNLALLKAMRTAKKSINLLTPNLNTPIVMKELARAAERGVRVRIVFGKHFGDSRASIPTRGGANFYSSKKMYKLLGWPRHRRQLCSRLELKWYSINGKKAVSGTNKAPNIHAKYMVVDDKVTYMGSSNMDNQSWVNSREIGIFVGSKKLSRSWRRQVFDPVFKKGIAVQECGGPKGNQQPIFSNKNYSK